MKIEKALQHGDSKEIDAVDLSSKLIAILRQAARCTSPQDVLNFILKNNLKDSVPNTVNPLDISSFCG